MAGSIADDGQQRLRSIQIVRHAARTVPRVALTFDDCDDEAAWLEILEVLDASGAPASFFPSGMRVEQFAETARATISRGHVDGSHGCNHSRLTDLAPEAIEADLLQDRRIWRSRVGLDRSSFFRPPYGTYDGPVLLAAARAGFSHLVLWDVDPHDWETSDPSLIEHRVLRSVKAGSIVELHVTPHTARALPSIVEGLRRRVLEPVSLVTLLHE
jgi:peptidoglycan-N-acetylglucosamine deacetylase